MEHLAYNRRLVRAAKRARLALFCSTILIGSTAAACLAQGTTRPVNPPAGGPDTLETFNQRMSDSELAEHQSAMLGSSTTPPLPHEERLPPAFENIRFGLGIGFVQGADSAVELTGAGSYAGTRVDFSSFLTQGLLGSRLVSGRLDLYDPEVGWQLHAGELNNELCGLVHGVRYNLATRRGSAQSISAFATTESGSARHTVLSYRNEITVDKATQFAGEIGSDRSLLLRGQTVRRHLSLFANYQTRPEKLASGAGGSIVLDVGHGISLYAGLSHNNEVTTQSGFAGTSKTTTLLSRSINSTYGITFPLRNNVSIGAEQTRTTTLTSTTTGSAVSLAFPFRGLNVQMRYQLGGISFITTPDQPTVLFQSRRSLLVSASYTPSRKTMLTMQNATRWDQSSRASTWSQVVASTSILRGYDLPFISGFPELFAADRMRVRVNHNISADLALSVEYGRLMPYQIASYNASPNGVMFMLRSHFNEHTPAHGSRMVGTVVDQTGKPVKQTVVKLGDYRAVTDEHGQYKFLNLPEGRYLLAIDPESLSADYRSDATAREIRIKPRTIVKADMRVIPLRAILGRVIVDKNHNGKADNGEGMGKIVLRMGDRATATAEDGSFAFYNVDPGKHTIFLDEPRLPMGYVAITPASIEHNLDPSAAAPELLFVIEYHDRPIEFQEIK